MEMGSGAEPGRARYAVLVRRRPSTAHRAFNRHEEISLSVDGRPHLGCIRTCDAGRNLVYTGRSVVVGHGQGGKVTERRMRRRCAATTVIRVQTVDAGDRIRKVRTGRTGYLARQAERRYVFDCSDDDFRPTARVSESFGSRTASSGVGEPKAEVRDTVVRHCV